MSNAPVTSIFGFRLHWGQLRQLLPFLTWMGRVNRETLRADALAGLTGAVIVLPQGVAFAIIAGLPPEYGLYTAMVTPIVAALFGSSWHLISGPTTAISIVLFAAVSHYADPGSPQYIADVLTITFLAGIYQLVFGIARLGIVVNFVSHTVVVGFTAGAAILIATSQMKNVLGIFVAKGESFLHTWAGLWAGIDTLNPYVFGISGATLVVAVAIKIVLPRLPNLLIAMVAGSFLALWFGGAEQGVKLVGAIPTHLPAPQMPDLSFPALKLLAPEAFAVALLGLIEAVSISRSIASKTHQRIDGNQEFIGQGLSNVVGSMFSAYAGSGSFTRSGVNHAAGARTPMSAIFAAVFLMLIVLLAAPLAAYLPVPAMAGVILVVAYNLIDFREIKHVITSSKSESAIMLVTFFATLFLELEFAIYLGVLTSLVAFLMRTSFPEIHTLAPDFDQRQNKYVLADVVDKPLKECPHLKILRVDMSIYFGSLNHIQNRLHGISEYDRVNDILIIGTGINMIDLSGAEMLCEEAERLEEVGGGLYFANLKPGAYESMARSHSIKAIGNAHFFDGKREAITKLQRYFRRQGRCENCTQRVFQECRAMEGAD